MKIIDAFLYNGEVDLLRLRLEELNDVVDQFVMVEGDLTFSGSPSFVSGYSIFSQIPIKYQSKLMPIRVTMPVIGSSWQREFHLRNVGFKISCQSTDLVMMSDVDEIPNRLSVELLTRNIPNESACYALEMDFYYYSFRHKKIKPWIGTVACDGASLQQTTPQKLRSSRESFRILRNAGWHLSYFGGVKQIIKKLSSYAHVEYNTDYFKNPERIISAINNNLDLFNRNGEDIIVNHDFSNIPQTIQSNPSAFNSFFLIND